jgi:NAD(P)H dehydrogenase (quinone)
MSGRRVLVTGAGGKTGRAVTRALLDRSATVRVFVRAPGRVRELLSPGDLEVAFGDQRDPSDLVAALDGCDALYAIAPNVSPDDRTMGHAAIAACRRAGVARLVLHSVIHPQLTAMPHHADKAAVEALVIESGLAWTILQPNAYLQNLTGYAAALRDGRYVVPYAIDRASAMVDLRDVAEVAATCLLADVGVHATFELSGPDELTPRDIAAAATAILGREVVAERVAPDAWARSQTALPDETRRRLHAMFTHYDQHGSPGDPTVLMALLGGPPRGLADLLPELLDAPAS